MNKHEKSIYIVVKDEELKFNIIHEALQRFVWFLIYSGTLWSVSQIFLKAYYLDNEAYKFRWDIGFFAIILYIIFSFKKWRIYSLGGVVAAYIFMVITEWNNLKTGIIHLVNAFLKYYNEYIGLNLKEISVSSENKLENMYLALTFIFVLVAILLCIFIFLYNNLSIYIFTILPIVSTVILIGLVPSRVDFNILVCMAAGAIGISMGKKSYQLSCLLIVTTGLIILNSSNIFSQNQYDKMDIPILKEKVMRKMQDVSVQKIYMNFLYGKSAVGGVGEGKLGNVGEVKFQHRDIFEIKAPQSVQTLYLRSFIGSEYTSEGWNSISPEDVYSEENLLKYMNATGFNSINQKEEFFTKLNSKRISLIPYKESIIEINNFEKKEKYLKVPYDIINSGDNSFEMVELNPFLKNELTEKEVYKIIYFDKGEEPSKKDIEQVYGGFGQLEMVVMGPVDQYISDLLNDLGEFREYIDKEKAYGDFVWNKYMELPKYSCEMLVREWRDYYNEEYADKSLDGIINYVKNYLNENATYSLKPGQTPKDRDFIEYFLLENKKGYCTYFATTATMMFRSMGIPARYVEGYIVTTDDILRGSVSGSINVEQHISGLDTLEKEDQISTMIKDTNAHAWTEIYMDGYGWIPIEVTPGYMENDNANVFDEDISDNNTINNTEPIKDDLVVPTQDLDMENSNVNSSQGVNDNQGIFMGVEKEGEFYKAISKIGLLLKKALFYSIISFVCILIFLIQYKFVKKLKKHKKNMSGNNTLAKLYYKDIEVLLKLNCFKLSEVNSGNYVEYCKWADKEVIYSIKEGSFAKCMNVLSKVQFSLTEINEEELEYVSYFYAQLCKLAYKRLNKYYRIYLKYIRYIDI